MFSAPASASISYVATQVHTQPPSSADSIQAQQQQQPAENQRFEQQKMWHTQITTKPSYFHQFLTSIPNNFPFGSAKDDRSIPIKHLVTVCTIFALIHMINNMGLVMNCGIYSSRSELAKRGTVPCAAPKKPANFYWMMLTIFPQFLLANWASSSFTTARKQFLTILAMLWLTKCGVGPWPEQVIAKGLLLGDRLRNACVESPSFWERENGQGWRRRTGWRRGPSTPWAKEEDIELLLANSTSVACPTGAMLSTRSNSWTFPFESQQNCC